MVIAACEDELLDELSMFLLFKRIYRSGHFHSMKVNPKLNITRPTFVKYLRRFIELDWAIIRGNGFTLRSTRVLQKRLYTIDSRFCFSLIIPLTNFKTKAHLRTQLRFIVLQQKYEQIRYATACKALDIQYSGIRKLSKGIRNQIMVRKPRKVQMSVDNIADTFYRSRSTGHREKQYMADLQLLESFSQKMEVVKTNCTWQEYQHFQRWSIKRYVFSICEGYNKGIIFKRRPDMIHLSNPLQKESAKTSSLSFLNNTVPIFFTTLKKSSYE